MNLQMEHFFERFHGAIRQNSVRLDEERRHLPLPAIIHVAARHAGARAFKVLSFEVADEQAVRTQEQRVVIPSRLAQSRQHLWPNLAVTEFVLLQPIWLYLQNKTNALHAYAPSPQFDLHILFRFRRAASADTLPTSRHRRESRGRWSLRSDRQPAKRWHWHSPAEESDASSACVARRTQPASSAALPWSPTRRTRSCISPAIASRGRGETWWNPQPRWPERSRSL